MNVFHLNFTKEFPRLERKLPKEKSRFSAEKMDSENPKNLNKWLFLFLYPLLTLRRMISISEYLIPLTRTGIKRGRYGVSTSLQIVWSANDNQNSQASRATVSLASWVLPSMYCNKNKMNYYFWLHSILNLICCQFFHNHSMNSFFIFQTRSIQQSISFW